MNSEIMNSIPLSSAEKKKMKQTRLPFAILSPVSTEIAAKSPGDASKKRKLSEDEVGLPAAKKVTQSTTEKKENTESVEVVDLIDDSEPDDNAGECAEASDSGEKIRIKLPIAVKKSTNKKLKLDKSLEEGEKHQKHTKKTKSHKKEKKSKVKEKKEPEIVCIDDDDDNPKPLETSVVEEIETTKLETETILSENDKKTEEKEEITTKPDTTGLPKPIFAEHETKVESKTRSPRSSPSKSSSNDSHVETKTPKRDISYLDESLPKSVESKSGSGIKRSNKKLSEEEKLKRQQKRDEQRRLEREAKEEQKRQEREAKEQARLKEKAEREAKIQKEKEEKEQARLREKAEREAKLQKEKEEKELQKKIEKENREKKRQAELEQKAEEKRQKELKREEERLKKEEEKQKKEQEKHQREEEERRKKEEAAQKLKKSAQLMEKFFVQKKPDTKNDEESSNDSEKLATASQNFMPFEVKENMKLAPVTRTTLHPLRREILEKVLNHADNEPTYLQQLKGNYHPGKSTSLTWQDEDDSQDIILIDTQGEEHQLEHVKKPKQKYKAKFLHFAENRRPAYYGTWRKRSACVKGRKPFGIDTKYFDYEVDSDEEWEEEEPGESLHGSDDEKDKDNVDDDYEVDNDFFVPHGHLSDEELEPDGDIAPEDNSPEAQKARLKLMQQEFAEEHKKKTEKIKPRLIGCIWVRKSHGNAQDQCSPIVWEMLSARAMIFAEPITSIAEDPEEEKVESTPSAPKKIKITEDGIRELIRLVHGNPNSKKFLSDEFAAYRKQKYGEDEGYQEFMLITTKIKEIAEYKQCTEDGPMHRVPAWFVKPEVLQKYEMTDLPVMNTWEYVLKPKNIVTENSQKSTPISVKKIPVTDEAMPDLIRLVHGNMRGRQFLIEEFRTFRKNMYGNLPDFKEFHHIGSKILQIAEYKRCEDDGPMKGKKAYFVHPHILKQFGMEDISLPNTWKYHTVEKKKEKVDDACNKLEKSETVPQQPGAGPLTKFAVKLTEEERRKSMVSISTPKTTTTAPPPQKKRVQLLMSVPRGESISETKKNTLISQFLQKNKNKKEEIEKITIDEDVITID